MSKREEEITSVMNVFSMGRSVEKGFPFLIFVIVFNYPVESTQESCEKLTRHFYKEKELTALLQLGEGKSANVKFLEMW